VQVHDEGLLPSRGLEELVAVHRTAWLVVQPRRAVKERVAAAMITHPSAVDRQSTLLVPVRHLGFGSRIIHPRILQAVAARTSHRAANIRHFHWHRLLRAECDLILSGYFQVERYV
jgi:hypothetical protein